MNDVNQQETSRAGLNEPHAIAILGGGCFWCTEAVFQSVRGVVSVTPGYAGGHMHEPDYLSVCRGSTGHIEVVQVVFDPSIVDYRTLLQIFFATHDPTTLNRQGADVGPQYASAIFYQNASQHEIAQELAAEVQQLLGREVVTQLRSAERFWPAEAEHHSFYERNPHQGYCRAVIQPKLHAFRQHFGQWLGHE